ncbi:MMPL family transporter [Spirillospora albida]|uniref:MMPL family transporter n=1 Tax=Spirillospora albida TaxID=58123 RepID=UPI000A05FB2F|nr:MMPL family transporter [Spirillospora albida]
MSALLRAMLASKRSAALTVALWIALTFVLAAIAPDLKSVESTSSSGTPGDSPSAAAQRELERAFPGSDALPAIVVVKGRTPAETAAAVAAVTRAVPDRLGVPVSPACGTDGTRPGTDCVPGGAGLSSGDRGTRLVIVPVGGDPTSDAFRDAVTGLRDAAKGAAPGATVAVTGPAGIIVDTVKVFSSGDKVLLLGTVLLVLLILLAVYRAPLLAVVPLLAVGVAMRIAQALGALLADAGIITISGQTASIMTVLLFGVGTDYALIITSRYREALLDAPDRSAAMRDAMRGVAESVLSSAATIVLAMFALLACVTPALRGFGPYLALGVAVMAVVAFTFIPAAVLLAGRAVFWPFPEATMARRATGGAVWRRAADLVVDAPRRVLAATLALLAVLCLGMTGYEESFDFVSGFRVQTDSATGQELIDRDLGPGEVAPATLLVQGRGVTPARAEAVGEAVAGTDAVARTAFDPRRDLAGGAARITVVLKEHPYAPAAMDAVGPVRDSAAKAARDAGIAEPRVHLAGPTAETADNRTALDRDLRVIVPLVLLIVGLVLAGLLRSLLAPLYLLATLLLSFFATVGLTVVLALEIGGDLGIGNRVTAYVFIFLVALGVDYNIFIMSRYRQETGHLPPVEALRAAITRTGGVVSSAGLILAGTFAVLMTQPIRELYQFGMAMAIGILLDTFVVRPLLVPAIVRLLGDRALWPRRAAAGAGEGAGDRVAEHTGR